MSTPLSDERFAEIKRSAAEVADYVAAGLMPYRREYRDRADLLVEVERLRTAGRHLGGALDALGEVVRSAVRVANAGDPAAAIREIAAYAQQAGVLDDLEPAGSPS